MLNLLWASLLIEELVRLGLRHVCISPGSRSTPLTIAAARHPQLQAHLVYDERAAGFMALGLGRASGLPAALICTSGSALANYFPAVVEAAQDEVPLLILSADRPPELQQSGANQTIEQPGIFGDYTRWRFALPCPEPGIDPRFVLSTVDQAIYRSLGPLAGPVHLNQPFREPLVLADSPADLNTYAPWQPALQDWLADKTPYTRYPPLQTQPPSAWLETVAAQLQAAQRGLLLIGRLKTPADQAAARALAETLNWPVYADLLSGLRLVPDFAQRLLHFEELLAHPLLQTPDCLLQIGGGFVSNHVQRYLDRQQASTRIQLLSGPARQDPGHRIRLRLEGQLPRLCGALQNLLPTAGKEPAADWLQPLQALDQRAGKALSQQLALQPAGLNEPGVARLLQACLPPEQFIFVGNSMPVRELGRFALPGPARQIYANRGASGIDGNLATAIGLLAGLQQPGCLLCGDLTLLHDLSALQLLQQLSQPLTLVVVNNHGGGIFHFLPIAELAPFADVFEPWFGTPHDLSFDKAAALFGLEYHAPRAADTLAALLRTPAAASRLIEVQTDRQANARLHQDLRKAVRQALETAQA
ncbi:MAG: 2-succinyl-5-enolpyruvyl-6-hydroxy-3-cyclohexene-1-carboxylic-acid synthase [Candidatus Sericytochromatia bacterium]|nr:2-succinyl-5-enolpyruvyl-6-hydroxy-3-cyclohexene-1-carboxylic-acid synthase [Candidatus Sericytochromatia bacterium]